MKYKYTTLIASWSGVQLSKQYFIAEKFHSIALYLVLLSIGGNLTHNINGGMN